MKNTTTQKEFNCDVELTVDDLTYLIRLVDRCYYNLDDSLLKYTDRWWNQSKMLRIIKRKLWLERETKRSILKVKRSTPYNTRLMEMDEISKE